MDSSKAPSKSTLDGFLLRFEASAAGCVDRCSPGSLSPTKRPGQSFLKVLNEVFPDVNLVAERDMLRTGWLLSG
eukprot:806582-Amphidinium_carterae.1